MSNGLEKYPKLRFPGFDEPYRELCLGNISSPVNRTDSKSKANIMMLSAGKGFIMQSDKYSRDNAGQSLKKYILLQKGELAYNHGASKTKQFGCCYELLENEARIPYVYHCFKIDKKEFTSYVALELNNSKMDKQLKRLVSSSARMDGLLNISFDDYMTVKLTLPSYSEQRKVAKFLDLLEQRIRLQIALVESLKKYKRGVSKAIFTQKISLSGCRNTWYRCNLADAITLQSGQDFPPYDYNDKGEGIPYMTGASCIEDGLTVVSRWTTTPKCFAYKGDTLLVCKGSGSGAVVKLTQEKVHIARQFMALRANDKMTQNFCFFLIEYLSDKMKRAATGLIEGIDRKTVLDQSIILPSIWEQEKIAKFLSCIVNKITQESVCLSQIEQLKKSLLQQLFI